MQTAITALGVATPPYTQLQTKVIDMMVRHLPLTKPEQRLLKTIYRNAGICYRHSVLEDFIKPGQPLDFFPNDPALPYPNTQQRMVVYKENALKLALSAIEQCLNSYEDFDRKNITHLITVSCTGMYAPGLDIEIVHALALPTTTQRVAINFMGCYGTFNGLKAAQAICQADKTAKVLVVSVELCTIHFQKEATIDNFISSAIFSDGAGALLIEGEQSAYPRAFVLTDFYCDLLPEGKQEMTWDIGNCGFDIKLSSYVPDLIGNGIATFYQRLLSRKTLSNVDYYAIHPGGKKILEACETALNISSFDNRFSYEVLKNYGNMSSATIIFVLKKLWETLTVSDHHKKLFCCAVSTVVVTEV